MTNILVTGANRGIGLALCQQLASRGDHVIAACRQSSDELDALDVRVETGVDVADDESVRALAARLADTKLDVLVNNAGIMGVESIDSIDYDSIRKQFEVNALGPLRVITALRGALNEGAKVIIVTSRMGSIEDNSSGGFYGYRMSKAAVNMLAKSLSLDLRGRTITLLHPGFVQTELTRGMGQISTTDCAALIAARIDEIGPQHNGAFLHANGESLPW